MMIFSDEARNGLKVVVSREIPPKHYPPSPSRRRQGYGAQGLRRGSCRLHLPFKNMEFLATANKKGFTLIEAMMAIAIAGLVMAPVFMLQDTAFSSVVRVAEQFQRLLFAKQFLYMARQEQKDDTTNFSLERNENNPKTILRYSLGKAPQNSALTKQKNLYFEKVVARGLQPNDPSITLITLRFKPQKVSEE